MASNGGVSSVNAMLRNYRGGENGGNLGLPRIILAKEFTPGDP